MKRSKEPHPFVVRAESSRLSRAAIETLARELPGSEKAVARLLEECIDRYFGHAFTTATLAALHAGIPVDARHLVEGTRLLPHPGFIGKLSARMAGDVVGGLVGAVADGRLSWEKEAVSLYLAAYWSRAREAGADRRELVRRTRMFARVARGLETEVFLAAASRLLDDDELSGLVGRLPAGSLLPVADDWTEPFLALARGALLDDLENDDTEPTVTRRRAVVRVGRNEPCPCGSGKKYKRCCSEKDQERLRDSSDVAGVTRAELRLHLEDHLDRERVRSLRAYELARVDPRRVDPQLHGAILNRLLVFEELDAVLRFFRVAGADHVGGHLWDAVDFALRGGRRETARALAKLAPAAEEEWLGFSHRLLASGIEATPALDLLEAQARRQVDGAAVDVACDLLRSSWPCLGILVARGVAPLANSLDRETLLQEIGLARDRWDMPALDPTEGMEDLWGPGEGPERFDDLALRAAASHRQEADAQRNDAAQSMLEEKEAELARIRRELDGLRSQLEERTRAAAEKESRPRGAFEPASEERESARVDEARVAKLRERVSRLRGELVQRHAERNQLRRQLERTQKRVDDLEAEREKGEPAPRAEAGDESDAEPAEGVVALSFRLPVFGSRFRASARAAPDAVRRRAVIVASRIAAGDEAAFRGTRRLKLARELYRQRVGREHRLIFRMEDQELEVVDLVPRKDLERTVRELARS